MKLVYVLTLPMRGDQQVYADFEDAVAEQRCDLVNESTTRTFCRAWGETVPAVTMTGKGTWSKAAIDMFAEEPPCPTP